MRLHPTRASGAHAANDQSKCLRLQPGSCLPTPVIEELISRCRQIVSTDAVGRPSPGQSTLEGDGFMDLLETFGPIWGRRRCQGPSRPGRTGIEFGSPSHMGPVYINDPLERGLQNFQSANRGSQYTESYIEFVERNEQAGHRRAQGPDTRKQYALPRVLCALLNASLFTRAALDRVTRQIVAR